MNGHDELVQILLDKGLDVDDQDLTNSSPLHLAAVSGKTSTAKILISKGAALESRWQPLVQSCFYLQCQILARAEHFS